MDINEIDRIVLDVLEEALPGSCSIETLVRKVVEKRPSATAFEVKESTWKLANDGFLDLTATREWKRTTLAEAPETIEA